MTLQELEQIKQKVLSERAMDKKSPRITVGMGTCGIKAGARTVMDELYSLLKENDEVIVSHVGCIGLCSYEPVMEVAMPGQPVVTYGNMTPSRAREVVTAHIKNGHPVTKWVLSSREQ